MLGTMRRREDDLLAISPPPEFQDIPISPAATTSSVPPPQDFRDLTPSPNCPEGRVLFSSLPDESNKALREFAEKISFNILNEAMIIATIVPQAGVSVTDFRSHHLSVPNGGKFSSDSYDSSSATSWEYLPEAGNPSNILKQSSTPFPLPLPLPARRFQKRTLRKSNSEGVGLKSAMELSQTGSISSASRFSHCKHRVVKQTQQFKRCSLLTAREKGNILCKDGSSGTENSEDCYTVPFECDIYSLPVDDISNRKDDSSISSIRFLRPHSQRDKKQEKTKFLLSEFEPLRGRNSDSNVASACARTSEASRGVKIRNSQRQKNSLEPAIDLNLASHEIPRIHELAERNNNEEYGRSRKKRRSKSIDIENQESHDRSYSQCKAFPKTIIESTEKKKQTLGSSFLNLFRRTRQKSNNMQSETSSEQARSISEALQFSRALPLPPLLSDDNDQSPTIEAESLALQLQMQNVLEPRDFAARIEKVKDCGWYWGPLSSQGAEDLLRGEPDGSFIVRDSSDVHYIFSLTFKLNGLIRHVRIEHDQGNFSFGPLTRFKAATIVDFVEKAVAHSRSGRYLFFLHRRPILGPMRVQLLHPYSRYIHPRSLQHMCRFVILKSVRRDLVNSLPLPNPLLDYLNTPQYYFEDKRDISSSLGSNQILSSRSN